MSGLEANVVALALLVSVATAAAQPVRLPVAPPVTHPALAHGVERTAASWRNGAGAWGEQLVEATLRSRGFDVRDLRLPGGQGIDRLAILRNHLGRLIDVKFVEVKTLSKGSSIHLGRTAAGRQMSRSWLAKKFVEMRRSGDPALNSLAREIAAFRRNAKLPPEALGELHVIRDGVYQVLNPLTRETLRPAESVRSVLAELWRKAPTPAVRRWALTHFIGHDALTSTTMAGWLRASSSPVVRGSSRVAAFGILAAGTARSLVPSAGEVLGKTAGFLGRHAGVMLMLGPDLYESGLVLSDYWHGQISGRKVANRLGRITGGLTGAMAGAKLGGEMGAMVHPMAAVAGALVGGATGYFVGASAGESLSEGWYGGLGQDVKTTVDRVLIATALPPNL